MRASNEAGFSLSILRPSIVYGTDMNNRSLFELIAMIYKGLFFFIGKPGASANYIHVENVAEALMLCGKSPAAKGEVFNLSDYLTLEALVAILASELGCSIPRLRLPKHLVRCLSGILGPVKGFPLTTSRVDAMTNRSVYSIHKIQNKLGYVHQVSFDEGMRQLVRSWKLSRNEAFS